MKDRKLVHIENMVIRRLMISVLIIPAAIIIGICEAIIGGTEGVKELFDDCKSIWKKEAR